LIQFPTDIDPGTAQGTLVTHPLLQIAIAISQIIAIWISFVIAARWLDRRPMHDFGFRFNRAWWRDLIFGLATGCAADGACFYGGIVRGLDRNHWLCAAWTRWFWLFAWDSSVH
jgi:hypothetical protein